MFQPYKKRKIEFRGCQQAEGWQVKLYVVLSQDTFRADDVVAQALSHMSSWLKDVKHDHGHAILIVHDGRDGTWSIPAWWIHQEILSTKTFHTPFDQRAQFEPTPKEGSMACVWELPVMEHERKAWVKHVLEKHESPDFDGYQADGFSGWF